jgi:hypothetical protein
MDIEVNKGQLYRIAIKWLNKHFGDLRAVEHNTYPESLFYVNPKNIVIMEWVPEYEDIWVNKEYIWSKIESIFHLSEMDTQSIMEIWLKDTYGLKDATPHSDLGWYEFRWKMITDILNQKNNK